MTTEMRSRLLIRKQDLYAALRRLDQDRSDGAIDDEAYRAARGRYEREAAHVLEQLDLLAGEEAPRRRARRGLALTRRTVMLGGGATGILAVAFVFFLLGALQPRSGSASITGSVPTAATAAAAPGVVAAEHVLQQHPRNIDAILNLGNAYLQAGDTADADGAYRHAMQLAPNQAEPPVLHALILGSTSRDAAALRLLHSVELAHPRYARAFLLDGIIASHQPHGAARAIGSWKHFLVLVPTGKSADAVRQLIVSAQKAARH